jgi:hypothetical protein
MNDYFKKLLADIFTSTTTLVTFTSDSGCKRDFFFKNLPIFHIFCLGIEIVNLSLQTKNK